MAATVPESVPPLDLPGDVADRPDPGLGGLDDTITDITVSDDASTIQVSADCVTLINVFTVEPENQARLVELLERATETVVRNQPGFISANVHAGLQGTRVTNYAQWASVDDLRAMLASPECRPHLDACSAIAESEPHVYRVSSVHHR